MLPTSFRNLSLPEMTLAGDSALVALTPQDRPATSGRNALISLALSLAVIGAVVLASGRVELSRLPSMVPASPAFWLAFLASYFVTPASEWLIFRRLWGIPPSGIYALLRKKIYNELLLGYLGEAYFYGWARQRVALTAAPFGAVKDVAILSAMTGNAVTVLLTAAVIPLLPTLSLGLDTRALAASVALIVAISLAVTVLRRRVFTLPRSELAMIARVHLERILVSALLSALLWHLAMPQVALTWWIALAALRLLVSRLPLVPNKDLLFAGVIALLLGHERDIGALMALMAGLILAMHLLLGSAIALVDLFRHLDRKP